MNKFIILILIAIGYFTYKNHFSVPEITASVKEINSQKRKRVQNQNNYSNNQFTCDGRQHCSQMTSRAEANYFTQNCPNTKMDGDNDGIPCERDSRW